jgi:predicted lipid-binding transport protein (Tim44 family)
LAALAAAVLIGPDSAEAQLAGESGFGPVALFAFTSLGPAATNTSERSERKLGREASLSSRQALAVGPETFSGGSLSGLFNRGGLLGGFAAGFLGCGLFGILFGRGLFGDLGGAPSYLGLFVQLALLAMLCWLIWSRWRGGKASDLAALSPRQLADPYLRSRDDLRARFDAPPDETHVAGPQDQSSLPRSTEVTDTRGECK